MTPQSKPRPYTDSDDQILVRMKRKGATPEEIAQFLDRNSVSICRRARMLGLIPFDRGRPEQLSTGPHSEERRIAISKGVMRSRLRREGIDA